MKVGDKVYLLMADGSRERVVITETRGNIVTGEMNNGDTVTDTRENWEDNSWVW